MSRRIHSPIIAVVLRNKPPRVHTRNTHYAPKTTKTTAVTGTCTHCRLTVRIYHATYLAEVVGNVEPTMVVAGVLEVDHLQHRCLRCTANSGQSRHTHLCLLCCCQKTFPITFLLFFFTRTINRVRHVCVYSETVERLGTIHFLAAASSFLISVGGDTLDFYEKFQRLYDTNKVCAPRRQSRKPRGKTEVNVPSKRLRTPPCWRLMV